MPGAPTGLTATASGTTAIDLSWSAPGSTGGSAITGYKIEVSPNGTSGWTDQVANTNSTATTYAHTGLAAGTTRHYRVSAINTNGAGTASNVDSATTGTTVPGAPAGLTATASGTTAIDLSWSAPGSTGGSAITGYKIEVSPNGTSGWTDQVANTNSTATTYAHTGLAAGTTRHYRVSAINTNGTGTASNVDSATSTTTPSSRTTFGAGTWLVNEEIEPGRYFTDPSSGCYWERLRDTAGSSSDILANEFIGFDSGQEIVDISMSDYAFKPDSECGTWGQTPVTAPSSGTIPPGRWLVGSQIPAGEYEVNASSGCYWERLRGFSGSDIIANDFVAGSGRQIVRISSSDVGFYSDADCGTWSRRTGSTLATSNGAESGVSGESVISPATDPGTIDLNRQMYRAKSGLR